MVSTRTVPLLSHQPLRLLFQLAYTAGIVALLPFWIISASIPSLRQNPKWTAKQSILVRVAYALGDMNSRIRITEPLSLEKGNEGDRFRLIRPSPEDVYKGPLASEIIKPATIGGTWFPRAPGGRHLASKLVVLHFHGGAFVKGDGRTEYSGFPSKLLIERGGVDFVLSVQYRLSAYGGTNGFPAALQDALTSYMFLLRELRIPAHQIVLCGDSAGGNLAVALLRYIEEFGHDLAIPGPKCVVLLSPWLAPLDYDVSRNPNHGSDILSTTSLRWGALAYTWRVPDAASHPYITPLGNPFATTVPILINTGTAEVFYSGHLRWASAMRGVGGNMVELHEEDDACHDTFLLGERLGFEESAQSVAARVGEFIRQY
ncbi:hypothetical protein M426DRAFT_317744 [Hypoxylon sp. CI-4A]|nr:hypothetical protein M426DRAFT_317744 [Hypoxylon sp. CI-4A]